MTDGKSLERLGIDVTAKHALQFAYCRRGLERISRLPVASDIGKEKAHAGCKEELEKSVAVAIGGGNVAGHATRTAQIELILGLVFGKDSLAEADCEDHLEGNRLNS